MSETEYVPNPLLMYRRNEDGMTLRLLDSEFDLNAEGASAFLELLSDGTVENAGPFVESLVERDVVAPYDPDDPTYFPPQAIAVETTMRCNLQCRHCYRDAGHSKTTLSIDAIRKAIREAEALGASGVAIGGGEPTMHLEFTEILRTLEDVDMTAFVVTSGTTGVLERPENLDLLRRGVERDRNKYTVGVSIYGPKEFDDTFKGLGGAFESTISTVRTLGEAGIPVQLQCVVSRDNRELLPEFVRETVADLPVELFGVQGERPMGRGAHRADRVLAPREYAGLARELQRLWEREGLADEGITLNNLAPYPPDSEFTRANFSCSAGTVQTTITPHGNITSCSWFTGGNNPAAHVGGDIYEDSLREVWHTAEEFWRLRRVRPQGTCGDCGVPCNRCPPIAQQMRGSVHEPDPFCPLGEAEGELS